MLLDEVVEAIDVASNGLLGCGAGVEDGAPDQLGFQRFEERLDHGVEANGIIRHIQPKATYLGGKSTRVTSNIRLATRRRDALSG